MLMAKGGVLLAASSGKLATDCGVSCETQSVDLWGSEPWGNDGVFTGSVTFEREAEHFVFDGGVDDICVVSPSSVSVSGTSVSATGGFVIMPTLGGINGRCCNWDPRCFTISVGGASYTKTCTGDESDVPFEDFRSGVEGAGIMVKDLPCVFTKAEMESLGYGMPPTIHFGHVHCDVGHAGIAVYTCYRIKYTCVYDCKTKSWGDPQRGTHTEEQVSDWVWQGNGTAECVVEPEIEDNAIVYPELEKPGFTPDCYYHWYANYECSTGEWRLTFLQSSFEPLSGWPGSWENCAGGACHRYMLNDDAKPSPPSTECQCYYRWSAWLDCNSGDWQIYRDEVWVSEEDETQPWSGSGSYYTCVTDTDEEPDPPEDTPTCVAYWEAYWNGASWEKYTYWSDVGETSGWVCSGTEYAYGAFAQGETPPDPMCA